MEGLRLQIQMLDLKLVEVHLWELVFGNDFYEP
jgi:hypothetical protein